jgi:hypothetical protein
MFHEKAGKNGEGALVGMQCSLFSWWGVVAYMIFTVRVSSSTSITSPGSQPSLYDYP